MSAIWSSETNTVSVAGVVTVLSSGESVGLDTSFASPSGQFLLSFQPDGNLVLYEGETVLWSSGTDGEDADLLSMQADGNLVIYAGAVAVWSTETDGNEGSYLVLQNDGNLVIYNAVGLQPLGVFIFPPDWQNGMIETLEWLTSVTESPQAVEQRMGLRLSPRQMFEMSYTLFNTRRSHFDLLVMAAAGSPIYLPLWHDQERLTLATAAGDNVLNLDTQYTEFQNCNFAVLVLDEYNFEAVEIDSYTNSTLTLTIGLTNSWPAGSRIVPVKKVRVESQASGDRHADKAYQARMRFLSLEPNPSNAEPTLGEYLGNYVLEDEPNEASGQKYDYQRKEYELDTNVGLQLISDVAPFINQTHAWFAKGRLKTWRLRGLLYALQGRRRPIWVPSFFSDFELTEQTDAADTVLTVKRCGFTDSGGPFLHRDHILIHMRDGTRLYRKLLGASIVGIEGLTESLEIDSAPGVDLTPDNVLRISFLTFCRLDQDTIELVHHTDTKGLTTSNLVWRTDPGIGGAYSETTTEVPPFEETDPPPLLVVRDPFKIPSQKLWLYAPAFSAGVSAGNTEPDYTAIWWTGRRPDEDTGFASDLFPAFNITPTTVTLPDEGSFLVRAKMYFTYEYSIPEWIHFRIFFVNSELEPVEVIVSGVAAQVGTRILAQSGRDQIYYAKTDPDEPLKVQLEYWPEGEVDLTPVILGGVLSPVANWPDNDDEPYHGSTLASGDSSFVIEWWPN